MRYQAVKRLIDIFICIIALPLALSIIFIFGILIRIESQGKCIYCQKRVGKNGKIFNIYKLRSMYCDSEKSGPQLAKPNDPRITKIGRFMRNTRIDEIPQVINVLKGDMSIIGPRPERPCFVEKYMHQISNYYKRLEIRPGLTGLAQVNGGYDLSIEEKLKLDLYYIENQSICMDLKIIFKTIKVVYFRIGAR